MSRERSHEAAYSAARYDGSKEVVTGRIVDGRIVVEGDALREGAMVTVLLEDQDDLALTAEQEALLLRSAQQADQGRLVDGWELLREIKAIR
jgi:hypothetical protein